MTDLGAWFPVVKVVHLGALVLWLGPSGGVWLALMIERRRTGEPNVISHHLYLAFLRTLWFQHLGVVLMLGTGVLLLSMYGTAALGLSWVKWKIGLIAAVIVPIELSDFWFSHKMLPGIFDNRVPDSPYTAAELRQLRVYHRWYTPSVLPLLLIAVILIMWLAVAKPV
jgi:hypothetical protein